MNKAEHGEMQGEGRGFGLLASALAALVCMLIAPYAVHARSLHAHSAVVHRTEVRDASLASSADSAALTLELNRTTSYRLATLGNPGRVVIDLGDSHFAPGAHLPHAEGIIQQLRAGSRPHEGLRIVLQLESSAAPRGHVRLPVRAHWRHGGARGTACLVVMVGNASPATPDSSADIRATSAAVRRANLVPDGPRPVLQPIPAPHAPVLADRDVVIAVDAGHGGKDPGAIGRSGTEEKNVTLAIARALAARIDEQPGMRAVLTRDGDVFLLLRERIDRASAAHADLFVSVHADSIQDRTISGSSVYVLSEHGATDEAARVLAERENSADQLGG
ncbi:MAG TPA: N-acetylmuramoyl-L-alanine amidase, partial [Steroidobacteraceae bacterium]